MPDERFNSNLLLTTTEVGDLLDVHPSTVKRWCNDEELPFQKTDGGHRRIHLRDALELARQRDIPTFLDDFSPYQGHVWSALREILSDGSYSRVISLSMGWLISGHWDRVGRLLVTLGSRPEVPLADLFDQGVQGFMREVGSAWRKGQLRVAEEHIASQTVVEALLKLRDIRGGVAPDSVPPRPLAVVGAMAGDLHHIGSLCVRLLLEDMGWRVAYLGADVPPEEFAAIQQGQGASLVCISFTPPHTSADVGRAVRILSEFYRPERPFALAVGGSGVFEAQDGFPEVSGPFPAIGVFRSAGDFATWVRGLDAPVIEGSDDEEDMGWSRN